MGETGRRLGDSIRDLNLSLAIVMSSNHSIFNFVAFGLSVINGGNDCRKTKEMQLIHSLGFLSPHGINERFTFCEPSVVPEPFYLFKIYFYHISLLFISVCVLHTYLNTVSCFASLYNHLFIYLSRIHSDEGLHSQTSVPKFFSLRCRTYLFVKLFLLLI